MLGGRYYIVHRYGKWRVIDLETRKVLVKVNTLQLAQTYLRLLGEDDGNSKT